MTRPIYLDHNATTPVAAEVFAAMAPWLQQEFGNPSSSHEYGRRAAQPVAHARAQLAELIGAQPQEIVFTGCATEANNLALLGAARALGNAKRTLCPPRRAFVPEPVLVTVSAKAGGMS